MVKITRTLGVLIISLSLALVGCESPESDGAPEGEEAVEETEESEGALEEETEEEAEEETDEAAEVDPLAAPDDVAEAPEDAEVTESGLASKVLTEGDGDAHPEATDTVSVHYTGWTTDGERFDSSVARGAPTSFPLNAVIEGWTEGVQLMVVGEKRRFWIPEEMAYSGAPGKPAGMLVFDVELFEIK